MTGPGTRNDAPPGLDPARLSDYLHRCHPDLAGEPPEATLIAGGRSNLTYRVRVGSNTFVLRRPPLGHVLATAHDMAREYRVISALHPTPVPVPPAIGLCTDPEPLGAPFYLMGYVDGTVYRHRDQTGALPPDTRTALAHSMIDTLAALHEVDPAAVGLADFGAPDGYLARQVRRWAGQLDRSRSRDLPGIDELRDRLAGTVPVSRTAGIVHGDYRLDNLIVAGLEPGGAEIPRISETPRISGTPRIAAVLDWEMATIGDPLADLGLLVTYWDVLGEMDNPVADGGGGLAGFPSGTELVERYAAGTGADVERLSWYAALGCYKLAVICEGIHYRYTLGQTVGEGFDRIGALVDPLVRHGLTITGGPTIGGGPMITGGPTITGGKA